jgi:hypothetical protein
MVSWLFYQTLVLKSLNEHIDDLVLIDIENLSAYFSKSFNVILE